ncbi:uncharacterized protein THITE_2140518 [Thermothielavioides terrestris NRRL 8126]|uniref:Uncharacterized protein n=1 Tax=Thermothielavioides terrestris (strain ATCC 38088 / NRRL 8126) TaxID=578455 RepID=G2QW32_THETT|nr:uncharacterized protein THITE_2140518 [Thermothielavioides terrestris NRRL 8126]AEO62203.1 hypothetical protein THITE_2140518 [Thermothielavioides terrestris NRRL 8126]
MFSSLVSPQTPPLPDKAGNKAHKHGSGHGNRQNASKHSKAPKTTKIPRGLDPGTVPASFLFAVNEFQVDYEPQPGEDHPLTDQWFNMVPPQRAEAYTGEYPGTVFRYRNGVVSPAPGYICVYRNTSPSAVPSRGLSGYLPIILALMGFHGRPGRASDVFSAHGWHQHRWTLSNRASNYLPKSGESPRGLYVQVCTDNLVDGLADSVENNIPVEQCTEVLQYLECCTILVQG